MYDETTVEAARDRDGDAADERPDKVDDILNWKQLGYEVGEPLAAESYERYPDSAEGLSAPKWSELVERLFRSPAVNGYDEAVEELTAATGDRIIVRRWREALQDAADAADMDAGSMFAEGDGSGCGGPEAALTALTDDLSRHIVAEDNPLCLAFLYAEKGLSVGEITEVFGTDDSNVRRRLHDLGLVENRESLPEGTAADDLLVHPPEGDDDIEDSIDFATVEATNHE